jgi:cinnamoyl-CoA reductase
MSALVNKVAPVLVTGGSGFLGSWCVQTLLARGYIVHTTVRSADKAAFLNSIPGADTRLKIFSGVDLLSPGSYEEAMAGCNFVLHTASPFFFAGQTEESLVPPAVEGTRNVLSTCSKLQVKKVVLTSSMAAVYMHFGSKPGDHVFTEEDWTDEAAARENKAWYVLSKLKAEQLAWEMAREPGCPYELAVINPSLIWGPQLPNQPHLNTSIAVTVKYFDGSVKEIENAYRAVVDVRDVAEAHVALLEKDGVWGKRYVLVGSSIHFKEAYEAARLALPDSLKANVPTEVASSNSAPQPVLCDNTRSRELLGINYRSVNEMVAGSVQSCLENGFTDGKMYSASKL